MFFQVLFSLFEIFSYYISTFAKKEEGIFNFGFTGGMQYKNFYAATLMGSFMCLFLYNRYVERRLEDMLLLFLEAVLIFFASARGTYIFLAIFLVGYITVNLHKKLSVKLDKKLYVLLVAAASVIVLVAVYIFVSKYVIKSETFLYRYRGVVNYLNYLDNDLFNIFFGDAKMAWSMPGLDYVRTVQHYVGWNGSYEMAFINVFIKNGLLGIVGFLLIFAYYIYWFMRAKNEKYKISGYLILFVFIVSSFVESFVSNIHAVFGIYCYIILSGVCGMIREEKDYKGKHEKLS